MTGNTVFSNSDMGICLTGSTYTTVSGNSIEDNGVDSSDGAGLYVRNSSYNTVYGNNFIGNNPQAKVVQYDTPEHGPGISTGNVFNLDAPTGGNFWSDHPCADADADGFCDQAYTGILGNVGGADYLPLVHTSVVPATIAVRPDTVNVRSKGGFVRVYIEVPGYDIAQIDLASIMISTQSGSEHVELERAVIGDFDHDGVPDLMVRIERDEFAEIVPPGVSQADVAVTGALGDVTFSGSVLIRVKGN